MLPKVDKKKKTDSDQLNLVDAISDADKLKHKRRTLIVLLVGTISLCLIFWLYQKISVNGFTFPRITYSGSIRQSSFDQILTKYSIKSGYLSLTDPDETYSFGQSIPDITGLRHQTDNSLSQYSDGSSSLPHGLSVRQFSLSPYSTFLITTPRRQMFIVLESYDVTALQSIIPEIYWSIFGH